MAISPKYYILKGREVVETDDLFEWGKWIETHRAESRVARTEFSDGSCVSTVFLGLDHNFFQYGPPILFETCVFSSETHYSEIMKREIQESEIVDRYSTWAEAEVGHIEWVEKLHVGELDWRRSGSDSSSS